MSDAIAELFTFVQTQTDGAWGDNRLVSLPLHTWTCVSLPVSTPVFNQPSCDPTHVVHVGLEMESNEPFRVYVDTMSVE
jgi:hypothetical protein